MPRPIDTMEKRRRPPTNGSSEAFSFIRSHVVGSSTFSVKIPPDRSCDVRP
jgi:hypothetical protein